MTGQVLDLFDVIEPDRLATRITEMYQEWDSYRQVKKNEWEEVRRYVYATDTTQTTNSQLPWKNKTTVPKLCQIQDNLYANYTATLFPQRKWLLWEANEKDADSAAKRDSIVNYMSWVITQPEFKHELDKIILDYIQFGNCFATVDWLDQRVQTATKTQSGYVGPVPRRINPLDIVFNPTAESFGPSPKMIRSFISMGEVKKMLAGLSTDENRESYEELYDYMKKIRNQASYFMGDWVQRDNLFQMDGFTSFRDYLKSDLVELITFYGDIYDRDADDYIQNHVIMVVDRHKIISNKPNPSFFGIAPIFHVPWRKKQDNLWGMGPLDNLVGMQYRMDHVENMKADIFDLVTYPVQKIKGFVEDFTWQPGEKIFTSEEGDVELVVPPVQALQANFEIQNLERLMEEMAGAPREAMGFRTPGEKTAYEVQQLQNASARLFQNKIKQFEEQLIEPLMNAMLELARRNLNGPLTIKIFDNDLNAARFDTLTVQDITGVGRIKPIGARHFSEQNDLIQNLTGLTQSNLWPFIQQHFSSYKLARIIGNSFNLDEYEAVLENVGIADQAQAQNFAHSLEEMNAQQATTATGLNGDYDLNPAANPRPMVHPGAPPQAGPT